MQDIIMDSMTLWILGAYTVGTVFGWYWGFKSGFRIGAIRTMENLIQTKRVRTREGPDGDVEILALDEDS
jgi:hypothetical protein